MERPRRHLPSAFEFSLDLYASAIKLNVKKLHISVLLTDVKQIKYMRTV